MSKFDQDMRRIERSVARLTGDPRAAASFRKELVAAAHATATTAQPAIVDHLVKTGKAGFANNPARNKALLVERDTGCILLGAKDQPIVGPRVAHARTPPLDKGRFVQHLKDPGEGENFVPHMYLDTKGNVTVGIGTKLETVQEAMSLPFVDRGTVTRAHSKHIENAYNLVKSATPGPGADSFESLTHIDLSEADATILALDTIDAFLAEILRRHSFHEYDSYPETAKLGLLDMVYTLGVKGTVDKFPMFTVAVSRRNWRIAAKASNRPEASNARNARIRQWFEDAAKRQPFFFNPSCKKRLKVRFQ